MKELSKRNERLESLMEKKRKYLDGLQLGIPEKKNFSESTIRSVVKALTWRMIGGTVTFFTSLRFSGSISTALSLVGSDFFSKAVTMFVGERLMNASQSGRQSGAESV